jgi:HEPN domain-containing protein
VAREVWVSDQISETSVRRRIAVSVTSPGESPLSKLIDTRVEFQELAETRLLEAKALLGLGKWDGAYYLAGYAVELALKACIIRSLMATDSFPGKDFSKDCYTHDYRKLIAAARLTRDLELAMQADARFEANWSTVKVWSEVMRYCRIEEIETRELCDAIDEPLHGVLPWLKTHW